MSGYISTGRIGNDQFTDLALFPDTIAYNTLFHLAPVPNSLQRKEDGQKNDDGAHVSILVDSKDDPDRPCNLKWVTVTPVTPNVRSSFRSFWAKVAKRTEARKEQNEYDTIIEQIYEAYLLESPVYLDGNISKGLVVQTDVSPMLQGSAAMAAATFVEDNYYKLGGNKFSISTDPKQRERVQNRVPRRSHTVRTVLRGVSAILGLKERLPVTGRTKRRPNPTKPLKHPSIVAENIPQATETSRNSDHIYWEVFSEIDPNKADFARKYKERLRRGTIKPRKHFVELAETRNAYIGSENLNLQAIDGPSGV